jgi:hypothetical protein
MNKFEKTRQKLTHAVLSNDIAEKEAVRQEIQRPGFFTGFSEDQSFVLKTLFGDVHRSLLEVSFENATQPA